MPDPTPRDTLYIPQGAMFSWAWPLVDADTGLAADSSGWSAACEIRTDFGGALVTRFHSNTGLGWPGVITFDASSNLILTLDRTFTAALTSLPRTARFDVKLFDPNGKPWLLVAGPVVVKLGVTTDV